MQRILLLAFSVSVKGFVWERLLGCNLSDTCREITYMCVWGILGASCGPRYFGRAFDGMVVNAR